MSAKPTMMMGSLKDLPRALWRGDVLFALALVGILIVLILPLHPALLDVALAFSLAFSVVVLMTVLFLENPLELSVFPTVLLVVTMLRLSLNVASTRLILAKGYQGASAAGLVIKAFGSFIMGGNFVIGLVVFAILVIINFVVITKGSGRIAEVVARFSLDALPGKQMAVDADLSAGLIEQDEARKRRAVIQDEINFYGAMDGAAKFVRGDAMAGLLITAINLLGGVLVGMLQKGMTLSRALETYSLLTVGDGLVSQVPALIVSVASGMLISKTSSRGKADEMLQSQLSAYPKALGISALMMAVFAFLPGMPAVPFLFLAGLGGWGVLKLGGAQAAASPVADDTKTTTEADGASEEEKTPQEMLHLQPLRLELGVGLVGLIKEKGTLSNRIRRMREELARDFGVVVPTVYLVDNLALETYGYCLKIKEIKAAEGKVYPDKFLALDPSGKLDRLQGEEGVEPVLGMKGVWIRPSLSEQAKGKGFVVADGKGLLVTHVGETLKGYLADLFSFAMQQQLVDDLPKAHQKLYADLVPLQLSASVVQRVLTNLLGERVSIRDFAAIVEGISEGADHTKKADQLTELVRQRLARQIAASYATREGRLPLVTLGSVWTEVFRSSEKSDNFALSPSRLHDFITQVKSVYARPAVQVTSVTMTLPALLVQTSLRPLVHEALRGVRPMIPVMSEAELFSGYPLDILGEV